MTIITNIKERTIPAPFDTLNARVTNAILKAERETDEEKQQMLWAAVSAIEEEISLHPDAPELEAECGQRGAVSAAVKAELYNRASRLLVNRKK